MTTPSTRTTLNSSKKDRVAFPANSFVLKPPGGDDFVKAGADLAAVGLWKTHRATRAREDLKAVVSRHAEEWLPTFTLQFFTVIEVRR